MSDITATYSAEDNKLRLYASTRLDSETFQRVKEAGYKWAPKQELFVAPAWNTKREDLALELAGEIEPEETTLAERAEAKADRLEALADKREDQANAFSRAADDLSRAFEFGQPILVGHHSERKARKTQERMNANQEKAAEAFRAIDYWQYRASGVVDHANRKNRADVRARRIKKLLADLRDLQRTINHYSLVLEFWTANDKPEQAREIVERGISLKTGDLIPWRLDRANMTPEEIREAAMQNARDVLNGPNRRRWINHILGRLSYERTMLGPVARFEGELTPVILQAFAREHGAHKPKAQKIDADLFTLESTAPLPLHIGDGKSLELTGDEWRDLMQSAGYEVPAPKPKAPPILNFRAAQVIGKRKFYAAKPETFDQIELTKAEFNAIHSDSRWTLPSACGTFRFKVAPDPSDKQPYYMRKRVAVFLTDSKEHAAPESDCVIRSLETQGELI
jgi:hypothetical protein